VRAAEPAGSGWIAKQQDPWKYHRLAMQANPLIRKNSLWDEVKIQRIKKIDKNLLWVGSNIQKRELPVNGVLARCQANLEMSGFYQSRNVRFSWLRWNG
jgi:hypothetical protein